MDWYCGNTKEGVRWGLYFDTLQVKFHCDGKVEWNPWWCQLAMKTPPSLDSQLAQLFGVNSGGDYMVKGQPGKLKSFAEVQKDADDFLANNKVAVCEGMSANSFYDQILKPSGVCWRAGMTARSSLFPHHRDHHWKRSLIEEGTGWWRGEREGSPFVAVMERLRSNATLLQMAASGNHSEHDLLFPLYFKEYCDISGGTDCSAIGKEECTCYCVEPGTCTKVMTAKYAKAAAAVMEMALDIVACVATGGTATAAKAGAKAAAKAALKAAAKKAARKYPQYL
jgi:hypothetical protein